MVRLSRRTLTYLTGVIRRRRAAIGSTWRRLNPDQQALPVLVHLRKGERSAEVAAGFGVGTATHHPPTTRLRAAHPRRQRIAGAGQRLLVPYKGRKKPPSQKSANSAHAKLRGPGERANAVLKSWRILRKLRCCPLRTGQLVKAIVVLQAREAE
ncbi:transposase family protein [Streptosporangium subroseum]|uniref:transposase family protein n=1 Tax=Streptosporangium subroseum TaxID=106412 RepID=UPI0030853371|nr:hypothetical protein OHB15_02440 [Streptosporangium subroseum]